MVPELPDDIVDRILEEVGNKLYTEDKERLTLQACLFVSRTFRHFALVRLFFHVVISNRSLAEPSYFATLRQILTPLPNSNLEHIDQHIGVLTMGFMSATDPYDDENTEIVQQYKNLLENPDLSYILNKLHQKTFGIKRLILDFSQTSNGIKWTDLNADLRVAFQSLVSSPFLEILEVRGVDLLPTDFLASSKVIDLRLQRLTPNFIHWKGANSSERKRDVMDPPPNLKHLVSDNTYLHKPAQKLTKLELNLIPSIVAQDSLDLVKECSGTIEDLNILFAGILKKFKNMFPAFHIDITPNLKSFRLIEHQLYPSMDEDTGDSLPFYNVLNVSAPMEFLTDIRLTYWYKYHDIGDYIKVGELHAFWDSLDQLLTGPMYPSLKTVSISVHARMVLFQRIEEESQKLIAHILQYFPRLSNSGKNFVLEITQ